MLTQWLKTVREKIQAVYAVLFSDKEALKKTLKKYYPRVYPDDPVDLYGALPVKFPTVKDDFFPHIMHPTVQTPLRNRAGMQYKFLFYRTFMAAVQDNEELFRKRLSGPVDILWSEKNIPYAMSADFIVVEHGWIPRSSYQISRTGSNSRGAAARAQPGIFAEKIGGRQEVLKRIATTKAGFATRPLDTDTAGLPSQYIVAPLQTGDDFNLKFSGTEFAQYYNIDNATKKFGQAFINCIEQYSLPYPVVFTQHPADHSSPDYRISGSGNMFLPHTSGIRTIDLVAATECCKGVITVNSNVAHEVLCFDLPCCALGRLVWAEECKPPLPSSIDAFIESLDSKPLRTDAVLDYIAKLLSYQWYLSDLQNPLIVLEILQRCDEIVPLDARKKYGLLN